MIEPREAERTGSIEQRGGRRVGWTEWGPSDGRTVVFCTGAGMSSSLGFGWEATRALRVRLICVDRAGLGRSELDPDKSFESWTEDVAAVLRAEHIARPLVVGFSQGAPFAFALAACGIASAVAVVAGQDELAHPAVRASLHPDVAAMVDAIALDRARFEASFASRVDADGLFSLVVEMSSEVDRALYSEPPFVAAYRRCLREGFARGPEGYVRDLTLAMSRWPWSDQSLGVPVHLWYGKLDTSPVHASDHGATLAARLHAARHVLEDEGGSLLWTRAHEILEALLAAGAL